MRYVLLSTEDFELLEQIKQQQLVEHYKRVLQYWANNKLEKINVTKFISTN